MGRDGSTCSGAAVAEVAHCHLVKGSAVEVLTAIHSAVPTIPDPAFAFVAVRVNDLAEQVRRTPVIQAAAVARLNRHRPHLEVTTKIAEGDPKQVILREASEWRADRVVLGCHGHGAVGKTVLGSTAAVAAGSPCSVVVARPRGRHREANGS